jgi:hypothetical protein
MSALKDAMIAAIRAEFPTLTEAQGRAVATRTLALMRPLVPLVQEGWSDALAVWTGLLGLTAVRDAIVTDLRAQFSITMNRARTVADRLLGALANVTDDILAVGNAAPTHVVAWRVMNDRVALDG